MRFCEIDVDTFLVAIDSQPNVVCFLISSVDTWNSLTVSCNTVTKTDGIEGTFGL